VTVDLGLSPDQQSVEELFSTFFAKEAPPSVARAAEPLGFDRALWDRLAETGAPGMGVEGATMGDLVVAAEQLGRAIAPVPLVEHLAASRAHPVPELCDGSTIATISLRPAVDGVWSLVPAGAVADVVVGVDGDELVAVRSEAPGSGPRNHAAAPLADRPTAGLRTVLGPASQFDAVLAEWQVLTAGALVGIAAAALDLGVEYAKTRVQFGVPIGTFQAVQHALAELPGLIDGARLLTHKAAWAEGPGAIDTGDNAVEDQVALASMAFVFAGDVATHATDRSLHVHGGYGFSEEYDIQLFYRRARGWSLVLDDPAAECRRLADRLFGAR
jgi:alkylation response protein AidB-like acyl-CoA dehydrogenase